MNDKVVAGVIAGTVFGGLCIASVLRSRGGSDCNIKSSQEETPLLNFEGQFIGSLDQVTSSTRFIIFDAKRRQVVSHQTELEHVRPHPG